MKALFVIIFGEDEFKDGMIAVKDMTSGSQEKVKISEIESYLKGRLVSR